MSPASKKLVLWALLIMLFLAIWQFLSPAQGPGAQAPPATGQSGTWVSAVVLVAACGVVFVAIKALVGAGEAFMRAMAASDAHFAAGRFDEAERALAGLDGSWVAHYRCAFHAQRATIAFAKGDREGALAALAATEAAPLGLLFRSHQRSMVQMVLGMRAFLQASAGDVAAAREEIAKLRAVPDPSPILLARAALAEARILDEEGDRAGLSALIERSRSLFREALSRRELALVRAYEAMLDASAASVYRQKGAGAEPGDEAVIAWVARFAPNAAPFARAASLPSGTAMGGPQAPGAAGEIHVEVSEEAACKVEASRPTHAGNPGAARKVALWLAAFILCCVGLSLTIEATLPAIIVLIAGSGGMILWAGTSIRRGRRERHRIEAADRALGAGDLDRAASELAFAPENRVLRARAKYLSAEVAMRRGDMAGALAETDRALVALAQLQGGKLSAPAPLPPGRVYWDLLRLVVVERAIALAALGRGDEAWAEIAWAQGFPTSLPVFVVLLTTRLVARDYEGAARAVETRDPGVHLSARQETLAELARFAGRPEARSGLEAARLRAEIRRDTTLARWVEAMAPGLSATFEQAAAEAEAESIQLAAPAATS